MDVFAVVAIVGGVTLLMGIIGGLQAEKIALHSLSKPMRSTAIVIGSLLLLMAVGIPLYLAETSALPPLSSKPEIIVNLILSNEKWSIWSLKSDPPTPKKTDFRVRVILEKWSTRKWSDLVIAPQITNNNNNNISSKQANQPQVSPAESPRHFEESGHDSIIKVLSESVDRHLLQKRSVASQVIKLWQASRYSHP